MWTSTEVLSDRTLCKLWPTCRVLGAAKKPAITTTTISNSNIVLYPQNCWEHYFVNYTKSLLFLAHKFRKVFPLAQRPAEVVSTNWQRGWRVSSGTVRLSSVIFRWGSSATFAIQVPASGISEALFPSHFPGIVEQIGLPGTSATLLPYATDEARSRCLFEKVIFRCWSTEVNLQ
jgi:hypothetical protein